MAHFAKLDSNNLVETVIVISNDDILDNGSENEAKGVDICKNVDHNPLGNWKQTSYNGNFRGNYAGIGFTYMENVATLGVASTDVFIEQQPYPSWSISSTEAKWVSPLGDKPAISQENLVAGHHYEWDEDAYQSDNTQGWNLIIP